MSCVSTGFQSVIFLSWESLHFTGIMSFKYRINSEKNSLLTCAFKSGTTRKKKKWGGKNILLNYFTYTEAIPTSAFS